MRTSVRTGSSVIGRIRAAIPSDRWSARATSVGRSPARSRRRPDDVGGKVAVAEPEPGLLTVDRQLLRHGVRLAADPPALLPVVEPGQGVQDGVVVGQTSEAVALDVVAGVDDDRQLGSDRRLQAVGQLRATDPAGEDDDRHPADPLPWSSDGPDLADPGHRLAVVGGRQPDDHRLEPELAVRSDGGCDLGRGTEQDRDVQPGDAALDPVVGEQVVEGRLGVDAPVANQDREADRPLDLGRVATDVRAVLDAGSLRGQRPRRASRRCSSHPRGGPPCGASSSDRSPR